MDDFSAQLSSLMSSGRKRDGTTNSLFHAAYTGDLTPFKSNFSTMKDLQKMEGFAEAILSARDADGLTALHFAAAGGRTEVCKFLLEQPKLDVNTKAWTTALTPLHLAISSGKYPTAVYLIENGADPNSVTKHRRRSPLHYVIENNGPSDFVELLTSKGAEINAVADCGTPLQYAAANGNKDFVKVLLKNHADPNVISHDLFSPLLASIRAHSIECVNLLLKAGAEPNICGAKGMTPLAFAASEGETKITKSLLNAGADPNVTDSSGMTPLEVAAMSGSHQDAMALFPVTSRIPTVPEWSLAGLMKHILSDEAREDRKRNLTEKFLLSKSKGADAFNNEDYFGATKLYTEAIDCDPTDATVLSNRSLCFTRLNEAELALKDAEACIALRPDWPKAYYRAGAAQMLLKDFEKAADSFHHGLKLDRENGELKRAFREAIEAKQNKLCSFPHCEHLHA